MRGGECFCVYMINEHEPIYVVICGVKIVCVCVLDCGYKRVLSFGLKFVSL